MSGWQSVGDALPDIRQEVLLAYPVPNGKPIIRLGSLLFKPFPSDMPIWKFDIDYGDSGAWAFSKREDEQPTHWMARPEFEARHD